MKAYKLIKIYKPVPIPWNVWRFLGSPQKEISVASYQICIGEDYGSLEECRQAIEWYVDQLGGKVKWKTDKSA